jgi:serine/threonine-protein kinase HipA
MPEREPVEVTVQIDGRDQVAGTLWIHDRGGQTASFRYADSYLTRQGSYALDPALPKSAGVFHTSAGTAMFAAFADSAPDRWGENPMRREEREREKSIAATPRTLGKADFLLGVRDDVRQGQFRFRRPGNGTYLLRAPARGAPPDRAGTLAACNRSTRRRRSYGSRPG